MSSAKQKSIKVGDKSCRPYQSEEDDEAPSLNRGGALGDYSAQPIPTSMVMAINTEPSWKRLLFERDHLHVRQKIVFSMPRFHFLGTLWIFIELAIFIVTLASLDYSFESMDMTTQMLKSSSNVLNEQSTGISPSALKEMSIVTMAWGFIKDDGSDYCGAVPGGQYYIYAGFQALNAVMARTNKIEQDLARRGAPVHLDLKNSSLEETGSFLTNQLLDLLLCNRHGELLFDQRYIVSHISHPCKGSAVFTNLTDIMAMCHQREKYYFRLEVAGVKSVCIWAITRPDPLKGWSFPCIHFSDTDMRRDDLRWILQRLEVIWNRIRASGLCWILLSIAMRIAYFRTAIEVTKSSLAHLRGECNRKLKAQKRDYRDGSTSTSKSPKKKAGWWRASGLLGNLSHSRAPKKAVPSAGREVSSGAKRANAKSPGGLDNLQDLLAAASIGVAVANNDPWYFGLAVVRQVLGAIYSEILTASAVTMPLAAWQALGMVVYHEAALQVIYHALDRLASTWLGRRRLTGIVDVGVLGYISMLVLGTAVQSVQLLNIDFLFFFRLSNWVVSSFWWLVLPGCGVDIGPCMYLRGDVVVHTIGPIYTSLLCLSLQSSIYFWKKKRIKTGPSKIVIPASGTTGQSRIYVPAAIPTKEATDDKETVSKSSSSGTRDWLHYLGRVGCPQCGNWIVRESSTLNNVLVGGATIQGGAESQCREEETIHGGSASQKSDSQRRVIESTKWCDAKTNAPVDSSRPSKQAGEQNQRTPQIWNGYRFMPVHT